MKKIISILSLLTMLVCGFAYAEEVDTDKSIKVNKYITDSLEESNEVDYFNFDLSKQGSVQIEFEFDVELDYTLDLITKVRKVKLENSIKEYNIYYKDLNNIDIISSMLKCC